MRARYIALATFALSGCTAVTEDAFLNSQTTGAGGPSLASSVAADYAMASVPGTAGAVTAVRQTLKQDAVEQVVVLPNQTITAGENTLAIHIARASSGSDMVRAPTRSAIEREMRESLPGVAMTISPVIGDNSHGVYGYATGPSGMGGSCLYAWQLAKDLNASEPAFGKTTYAAKVRLRYCDPSMPQDRIAAMMQGLRIRPVNAQTFETLAFAAGSGARVLPDAAIVSSIDPEPQPRRVVERPRRARIEVATPEPEEAAAEAVSPRSVKVPLPGETAVMAKDKIPESAAGPAAPAPAAPAPAPAAPVRTAKPVRVPVPDAVAATTKS